MPFSLVLFRDLGGWQIYRHTHMSEKTGFRERWHLDMYLRKNVDSDRPTTQEERAEAASC